MELCTEMLVRRYLWRSVAQNPAWQSMTVKISSAMALCVSPENLQWCTRHNFSLWQAMHHPPLEDDRYIGINILSPTETITRCLKKNNSGANTSPQNTLPAADTKSLNEVLYKCFWWFSLFLSWLGGGRE